MNKVRSSVFTSENEDLGLFREVRDIFDLVVYEVKVTT